MINKVIAVYPGRFQPMGKHHAATFLWLQKQFGANNTYIVTSDKVELPKSPLNFKEKKAVIDMYGFGNKTIKVKNPYKAEELLSKFDPNTTAVVFMVGEKDMKEDARFKVGKLKSGADSYFQNYNDSKDNLQGYDKHGYLITAPHISLNVPGYGEMSGTKIRQALGDPKLPKEKKKKVFEKIFGWYSEKLANYIIDKFTVDMQESVLTREWWNKVFRESKPTDTLDMNYQLLVCGGAAGHMAHPFNIDWVKTGPDLVKVFQQSINFLNKKPASVKIDGVNASIRLITLDGKKTFVLDRGSNKPLDVKGITKADLEDRFGAGHGMIKIGGTVLDIFNDAIPESQSELKRLGLWDNPNILFNIEYVAGSTNVLAYNKNFLAIHGLLEIVQVTPTKRTTKEKVYNKKVLQDYLNKLNLTANGYGYEVLGSVPTTLDGEPNLQAELNKKYTVNYGGGKEETKTLGKWLAKATLPDTTFKTKDGKVVSALSKDVLSKLMSGMPLDEYVADPKDYKSVVDGFVIYLATMKLGDAVLAKLSSPLGPVSEHEGIVIRDKTIYNKPFKITGKFILGGLASSFRK
jgi:hypothetical protein